VHEEIPLRQRALVAVGWPEDLVQIAERNLVPLYLYRELLASVIQESLDQVRPVSLHHVILSGWDIFSSGRRRGRKLDYVFGSLVVANAQKHGRAQDALRG